MTTFKNVKYFNTARRQRESKKLLSEKDESLNVTIQCKKFTFLHI